MGDRKKEMDVVGSQAGRGQMNQALGWNSVPKGQLKSLLPQIRDRT